MRRWGWGVGLAFAGCLSTGSGVQGSGVAGGEDRTVDAFTRVEQLGSADLEVEIGAPQRVRVEADDNIVPLIETKTVEGALRISSTQNYSARKGVRVVVAARVVVHVSGSGDVKVTASERVEAHISGSGSVRYGAGAKEVVRKVSGSGSVEPM